MSTPWHDAPLPALVQHILEVHHAFCRREMSRLSDLLAAICRRPEQSERPLPAPRLAAVGAERDDELRRLQASFQRLCRALELHLQKEETVLFPLILQIAAARQHGTPPPQPSFGGIAHPIRMIGLEHDEADAVLAQMRHATANFQPPPGASAAYRHLCAALRAFDADMRQHVLLEDQVLFPRALAAEQEALAR